MYPSFNILFQSFSFKAKTINLINQVLKKDPDFNGVGIVRNGIWTWENSINTNWSCLDYLYEKYLNSHEELINLSNIYSGDLNKLINFFEKNYNYFIHEDRTMELKCSQTWGKGSIANIMLGRHVEEIFGIGSDFDYDSKRGVFEDMRDKVDGKIILPNGNKLKIQLKVTKTFYIEKLNCIVLNDILNLDEYKNKVDLFGFVDIINDGTTSLSIVKNEYKDKNDGYSGIHFFDDNIIFYKIFEMDISTLLHEINMFCFNNDILFNLNNEGDKNKIEYTSGSKPKIKISIPDPKEHNFYKTLEKEWNEIKKEI